MKLTNHNWEKEIIQLIENSILNMLHISLPTLYSQWSLKYIVCGGEQFPW